MSRIGKNPVLINQEINIIMNDQEITITGPKGQLKHKIEPEIGIQQNANNLYIYQRKQNKTSKALHGLYRTIINNMVIGVSKGFCKILQINGVGYRAQIDQEHTLVLNLGYSHPIAITPPADIKVEVENNTIIKIYGINKETVGQIAAKIRSFRPPEPYKGKGIKYENEVIRKKVGKASK